MTEGDVQGSVGTGTNDVVNMSLSSSKVVDRVLVVVEVVVVVVVDVVVVVQVDVVEDALLDKVVCGEVLVNDRCLPDNVDKVLPADVCDELYSDVCACGSVL